MSTGFKVVLMQCPHGVQAVSLDTEAGGTRFAGTKCCGQWRDVKEWSMSLRDLSDAARLFHDAHDEAQEQRS